MNIMISKIFPIFAVRRLLNSAAFKQFFRNYTILRSFSHSFSSAIGGLRKPERATLFLFIVLAIFLQMRRPVNKNCTPGNNSTCAATCVHETNTPTKKQFKAAWHELVKYHDNPAEVPADIQKNLMYLVTELVSLHQQCGQNICLETSNAIDWLNQLHKFFNQLNK